MKNPKLGKIINLMERGADFDLTNQQYKTKTGAEFPKSKSYAEKRSAVARTAKEYGFQIEVIPQKIKFRKL